MKLYVPAGSDLMKSFPSHQCTQASSTATFFLDFIQHEEKKYVHHLTEKVLCATEVQLLMSGIFSVSSCISLPGKISSVSRQIKSALAVSVLLCRWNVLHQQLYFPLRYNFLCQKLSLCGKTSEAISRNSCCYWHKILKTLKHFLNTYEINSLEYC